MFYTLRKLIFLAFYAMLAGLAFYIYQKRAIFNPLVDLVEVMEIRKDNPPRLVGQVSGKVIKIGDELGFQMRGERGLTYNLRLTGLESTNSAPVKRQTTKDTLDEERQNVLKHLILSNHVRADLNYINEQRSGLAMVYLGETNVNTVIAEGGLAKVKREYLRGLPWKEQYRLVRAERKAREKRLGLWSKEPESGSPIALQ